MTVEGFEGYDKPEPARIIYGMSARDYHSDADGPRLSQSLATICVNQSPLHAWQAHPLLGARPYEYEPSDDDGSLIHSLVLEPDSSDIYEIDTSTITTKDGKPAKSPMATAEGKAIRDAALAAGKIPVLSEKLAIYKYKAKALRSRFEDMGTVFDGESEVVIYWTEQTPFGPVRCRCRIDHIKLGERAVIIDLKSTKDAHPRALKRAILQYGYDVQHAAYTRALAAALPDYAGRIDMVFAFGELEKPYCVSPVTLNGEFRTLGEARWLRGRDRWARCLAEDDWSGYPGGELTPPAWALAQEMADDTT